MIEIGSFVKSHNPPFRGRVIDFERDGRLRKKTCIIENPFTKARKIIPIEAVDVDPRGLAEYTLYDFFDTIDSTILRIKKALRVS